MFYLKMPMKKISTLLFIVKKFSYRSKRDSVIIQQSFKNGLEEMPDAPFTPSDHVIDNILGFARAYEVLETETAGYAEMILN